MELSDMKTASRELPLHTPSRALWKRIANEIETGSVSEHSTKQVPQETDSWWTRLKEREFTFSFPQLAGAGAVFAAFLIFGFLSFGSETSSRINLSGAQTAAVLPDEDEIVRQLQNKMKLIEARKANWNPEFREDFNSQLDRIESSLTRCRKLLEEHPDDLVQQEMVRSLYKEKLQLLIDIERLKW